MTPALWRAFRAILVATIVLAGALLFAIGTLKYAFRNSCDRYESVLAEGPNGRTVKSTLEACTVFGASNQEWVDLVPVSGRTQRILTFTPWGGEVSFHGVTAKGPFEPVATWTTPNTLRITIGTVGSITEKHEVVDGVHVKYDIGAILND